jgi:hypothetical protein
MDKIRQQVNEELMDGLGGRVDDLERRHHATGGLTERLVTEGRARPATRTLASLPKPLCVTVPRPLSEALAEQRDDRL